MADQTETLRSAFVEFCQSAEKLGLHLIIMAKTQIGLQNLGAGSPATDIMIAGNTELRYTWDPYNHPLADATQISPIGLYRRIGVASSAMHSMQRCLATTEIESGQWTPSCNFIKPAFFKFYCTVQTHGVGPCWQMTLAGCSLFTWGAGVRYWVSGGRIMDCAVEDDGSLVNVVIGARVGE